MTSHRYRRGAWDGQVARASTRQTETGNGRWWWDWWGDVIELLRPAVWNVIPTTLDVLQVRSVLSDVPCRRQTGVSHHGRRGRRWSDGAVEGDGVTEPEHGSRRSEIGRRSVRYQRRMSVVMQFWGQTVTVLSRQNSQSAVFSWRYYIRREGVNLGQTWEYHERP